LLAESQRRRNDKEQKEAPAEALVVDAAVVEEGSKGKDEKEVPTIETMETSLKEEEEGEKEEW